MIPKIIHRTVPSKTKPEVERYWLDWCALHPGWEHMTWRDPISPDGWETGHLWDRCVAGAQLSGMMRLEILWRYGGIYLDSDVEPVRAMDELISTDHAFAVRESERVVPDFVLGAPPKHPAIRACLDMLLTMDTDLMFSDPTAPWRTGPGITTAVFESRSDVTILPTITFAPYDWSVKHEVADQDWTGDPQTFGIHRWAASWPGAAGHDD